jgi:hypothetical protein
MAHRPPQRAAINQTIDHTQQLGGAGHRRRLEPGERAGERTPVVWWNHARKMTRFFCNTRNTVSMSSGIFE